MNRLDYYKEERNAKDQADNGDQQCKSNEEVENGTSILEAENEEEENKDDDDHEKNENKRIHFFLLKDRRKMGTTKSTLPPPSFDDCKSETTIAWKRLYVVTIFFRLVLTRICLMLYRNNTIIVWNITRLMLKI